MTYHARQVLSDCQVALEMLEEEADLRRWRIHWAAAVALLRAVGHVLEKADGRNPAIRQIASQRYRTWKKAPEHLIFREFIEKERNTLLKEYDLNIHPLEEVPTVIEGVIRLPGNKMITVATDILEMGNNIYWPLMEGPWAGEDAREILNRAIDWWVAELDLIDHHVSIRLNSAS